MKVMLYEKDRNYDRGMDFVIKSVRKGLGEEKQDDFLGLIAGSTGSGKSNLMLWIMETYLGKEADVKYLGLNKGDFAKSLYATKNKKLPRFCGNDEANISKRESLSRYNKAIIDLYFSIRKLRIFHIWCNPSIDMIDKLFIEERIKGLIFIISKGERIRRYYYFTRRGLLKIWKKYGNLKVDLLRKVGKEYAFYQGWFKEYNGFLLESYNKKKDDRVDEKVDDFHSEWAARKDMIKRNKLINELDIKHDTFVKYEKELLESGLIERDKIVISGSGRKSYPLEYIEVFRNHGIKKHT